MITWNKTQSFFLTLQAFKPSLLKIVLQRVKSANVHLSGECIASIKNGYVLLCGFVKGEDEATILKLIKKILKAKLFENWKKNIVDMNYEILVLSQFTLFGKLKGTKPDFHLAEEHVRAKELFEFTIKEFRKQYLDNKIACGVFGKELDISLVNHGPVTIIFDE